MVQEKEFVAYILRTAIPNEGATPWDYVEQSNTMTYTFSYDDEVIENPHPVIVFDRRSGDGRGNILVQCTVPYNYSGTYGTYDSTVHGDIIGNGSCHTRTIYNDGRPEEEGSAGITDDVSSGSSIGLRTFRAELSGDTWVASPSVYTYGQFGEYFWQVQSSLPSIIVNDESDLGKVWKYIYSGDMSLIDIPPEVDVPDDPDDENEPWDDDSSSSVDDNSPGDSENDASSCAGCCNYYVMTPSQTTDLFQWFWNDMVDEIVSGQGILSYLSGFFDQLGQALVSVQMYPFEIPSNADASIKLGRYLYTGLTVRKCTSTHMRFGPYNFRPSRLYNNFLDYPPYTEYGLYLPYIGYKVLDANLYMNMPCRVTYDIDLTNGSVTAYLEVHANGWATTEVFSGRIGMSVPYSLDSGKDLNRITTDATIQSVTNMTTGAVGSAIGGSPSGGIITGMESVSDQYLSKKVDGQGTYHSDPVANQNVMYEPYKIQIVYKRPQYNMKRMSNYGQAYGFPWCKTVELSSLKGDGFTVCHNVRLSFNGKSKTSDNISIYPTEEEKEIIKNFLESGVYL